MKNKISNPICFGWVLNRIGRFGISIIATTVAGACLLVSDAKAEYLFTKVADDSSALVNYTGFYPQINSQNQIAFSFGNQSSATVARWDNGIQTTIAQTGDPVSGGGAVRTGLHSIAINDSGTVAFRTSYSTGAGVVVGDGNGLTEVHDDPKIGSLGTVAINNDGRVVASIERSGSTDDIFDVKSRVLGGGTTTHISSASNGEFSFFQASDGPPSPDINNSGDVAVRGQLRSNSLDGIYVDDASSGLQKIADTSDGFNLFGNIVDINDVGQVGFVARPSAQSSSFRSLYVGQFGSAPTLIADGNDFDSISEAGLLINNVGDVLFDATFNGNEAVYSGGDPVADRIVGVGDMLDGGTITSVLIRRGMLNDSGNFVFRVHLDDTGNGSSNRTAIFFAEADVAAVPEPSSVALCLCFVFGFFVRKWKNRVGSIVAAH